MSLRSSFLRTSTVLLLALSVAHAADLRITIPKRSKPTPVQKLNRDGVKAVQKHHYDEARKLFYKAYLLDPDDPFTLNNLGYISELEGDIERAQRYYDLAAQNSSDAVVDVATNKIVRGDRTVREWYEDWLFERSSKATTRPDGGTMAQRCPNCGAPLDVDLSGVCSYCKAPVMSGDYDWVLARIDQVQ